jgi:hypothetical protein
MTKYHTCVWIDHLQAKIFEIDAKGTEKREVNDHRPVHHLHRKANHVGLGTVTMDPELLEQVANALHGTRAILIVGPGEARKVLAGYLQVHYPRLAKNIWGIQAIDHPSDTQIVAQAREFFEAADRMHA